MASKKGPEFARFLQPIIEALKEKGGSGTASEIIDRAIEILDLSEAEQNVELGSGGSRVRNQAQWARHYLFRADLIASSTRGVWKLTEKGAQINPSSYDFVGLVRKVLKDFNEGKKNKKNNEIETESSLDQGDTQTDYRIKLLQILRNLPPDGFERLCQRLLRESGFEEVVVTGRSGDGGIDGMGILQINPFVSFNVLFQCKRYSGSVSPSQIRDFRGAMLGRADKGIILTTGMFTLEAKKEARRDGAPPIELVDCDDLIKLFEESEFGLIPRKTYSVDEEFFNEFQ